MKFLVIPIGMMLLLVPLSPVQVFASQSAGVNGKIRVASCQFPVSANVGQNAAWIMQQMKAAADSGAEIVHFPECALSGYPGVDLTSLEGYDWDDLRHYTESVMDLAAELKIRVLLGSMHWLGEGYKPMNCLYLIDTTGKIIDRYDKRFCTSGDLDFFSAGAHDVVFEINGVKCGLLICFDVRFPELYREYRKLNVDVIFQSFYNARQKPGGIHPLIMPVTAQTRAATNHFYMSLSNSSAPGSWPCHFITPDGLIESKLDRDEPGILLSEVDLSQSYYDASREFRERAMDGKLSSEEAPDHLRYLNRQGM
ncbi:MAG: carbon-nitrogen hydrolase family protein [Bacteroidota bacterium]